MRTRLLQSITTTLNQALYGLRAIGLGRHQAATDIRHALESVVTIQEAESGAPMCRHERIDARGICLDCNQHAGIIPRPEREWFDQRCSVCGKGLYSDCLVPDSPYCETKGCSLQGVRVPPSRTEGR
jgi:hypothetical protein